MQHTFYLYYVVQWVLKCCPVGFDMLSSGFWYNLFRSTTNIRYIKATFIGRLKLNSGALIVEFALNRIFHEYEISEHKYIYLIFTYIVDEDPSDLGVFGEGLSYNAPPWLHNSPPENAVDGLIGKLNWTQSLELNTVL